VLTARAIYLVFEMPDHPMVFVPVCSPVTTILLEGHAARSRRQRENGDQHIGFALTPHSATPGWLPAQAMLHGCSSPLLCGQGRA